MSRNGFKDSLLKFIIEDLELRISDLKNNIRSVKESYEGEEKSSAGDKYETGREMIGAELEKYDQVLNRTLFLQNMAKNILKSTSSSDISAFGSIIETDFGTYILGLPIGKLNYSEREYFGVSEASPIGIEILGKKKNDIITFQNRKLKILNVY